MTKQTIHLNQRDTSQRELLRMFLKCASGYSLRDSAGNTNLIPEDQTEKNIRGFQELVKRGLVEKFEEPDYDSLGRYLEKIKKGPHPNKGTLDTSEKFEAHNEYLRRRLNLKCAPYGIGVASSLVNNGKLFLGYSPWQGGGFLEFQEFLELEEFFYHLRLGNSANSYKSDSLERNADLVNVLKREKIIERDGQNLIITPFGQNFDEMLLTTFDTYSKSKETQERWIKRH